MLCYADINWKTSAHQGLVCRWRSPISVLCSYVLFTSSTVLCPPPCSAVAYLMCSEHRPLACCVVLCCTVRASWWLSLVVPVWCGGTRRKWVRGNNSVPQASTIVTDYALPPPVSHGSWTTLILEQRFKMSPPARKVVISLGKVKWSESVVFFWFC